MCIENANEYDVNCEGKLGFCDWKSYQCINSNNVAMLQGMKQFTQSYTLVIVIEENTGNPRWSWWTPCFNRWGFKCTNEFMTGAI